MTDKQQALENTEEIREAIESSASNQFGEDCQVDWEHGQWWVTKKSTGSQWSVFRCYPGYFDFELVTEGDNEC